MANGLSAGLKIGIVGGGPSGLTLARILILNGITDVTIFELESSRSARTQGGSLDLREATGQAALKEAGLYEDFVRYARVEGEDFTVTDDKNNIHISIRDQDTGRPEIDRQKLRDILIDSLPEDTIKWGSKVNDVQVGTITLVSGEQFTDFDLIVGADGAWSKVRPLLTSVKPFYSGISGYEVQLPNIVEQHPEASKMLGRGSYFALGDGRCMLMQRQGNGGVKILAAAHKPENWISDLGFVHREDTEQMKRLHLDEYSGFAPELRNLFEIADPNYRYWPLYMLPVGLKWRHKAGVTLVGDAAHLMTPFAGEGVNNAMADSVSLAKLIIKSVQDGSAKKGGLDTAVEKYEQEMYARVEPSSARTWRSLQGRFFSPEPAKGFSKVIQSVVDSKKPSKEGTSETLRKELLE